MGELVLRDETGHELYRAPMIEQGRYELYQCCDSGEPFSAAGTRYVVLTVAWQVPAHICICSVRCLGNEPTVCAEDD